MNKIKKIKEKAKSEYAKILAFFIVSIGFMPIPAYAASIPSMVENAADDILITSRQVVKTLVTIVIVIIGFILIKGGQNGKSLAMERAGLTFFGIACILWAPEIRNLLFGWF